MVMPLIREIGRQELVGLGFETTAGTSVAPTFWLEQTSVDMTDSFKFVDNAQSLGRMEDSDDQALVSQMSKGKLAGNVGDQSLGYLLACTFGSWASALHAGETTVYDHTFTVLQNAILPTVTVAKVDKIGSQRFALGTLADLEISAKAGDWANFSSTVMAKLGASASDTPAMVSENRFSSKHVSIKFATNIAGLSGATAIAAKSVKIKIDRKSADETPLGAIDPLTFISGPITVTGEFVLSYDATTHHDLLAANTIQALQIQLKNSDTTIGTTTNPTVTFTAPRARLQTWALSTGLDQVVDQTVGFKLQLDRTAGYMLQAVLANTKTSYV
jgi:hypothetical protein